MTSSKFLKTLLTFHHLSNISASCGKKAIKKAIFAAADKPGNLKEWAWFKEIPIQEDTLYSFSFELA